MFEKKPSEPLVSVIVPVYKVEQYLDRCIQSILCQTYRNLEVILVDDGSPDKCGYICDSYKEKDKRIKVIHKQNGGLSSARNAGIIMAKGDYLSFIDSDDWITIDMFEYMVTLIKQYQADIVSISYLLTEDVNQKIPSRMRIKVMNKEKALEYFMETGMQHRVSDYPAWGKLFKRYLFKEIRFPVGTLYEDYPTNVQLIMKCNTYVKSSKICYLYFQGGQSIVRSNYKRQDDQMIDQCISVCNNVENESDKIRKIAAQKLARSYFSLFSKIAIYGFSENINEETRKIIIKKLTRKVRANFIFLMKSKMPLSRKILLIVLCINYYPLTIFRKIIN